MALALVVAAVWPAAAQSTIAVVPQIEFPYQKYVLGNGLTLIVHEDHTAPLIAVNVTYKVGSRDERPGRTGFAHLFEHLLFNGSEHYDGEFFKPLQAAGASGINGNTTNDRTSYFETFPVGALDRVLWLESDRMGHLLGAIDQKKLDEQRGVVQNEKRESENSPYGKLPEILAASTYPPGHPYSWTTIGSMDDLNAATLDDVKDWFRNWYGPSNAVLVIAGDVQATDIKRKVEQYFGDIPAGPPVKRWQSWVSPIRGEKRLVLEEHVPQTLLLKTWNIPPASTREYQLLYLAAGVLQLNSSGRLYERLVRRDQSVTNVSADLSGGELGSQLQISAEVRPGGDLRAVELALDEELGRLIQSGPSAQELERVKTVIYAGYARTEALAAKASLLAIGERSHGSPDYYKKALEWTQDATPSDVRAAAQTWLTHGGFVLEMKPRPLFQVAKEGVDRTKLPDIGAMNALELPRLQVVTLSNGLKVALAERHNVPLVRLQLIIDAGFAAESVGTSGIAQLSMQQIDKGTKTRDARAIAELGQQLGARLSAYTSLDTSVVSLSALKARFEDAIALFSDVIASPAFPKVEFERGKKEALAALEQEKTNPEAIAWKTVAPLVYGDGHAYSGSFSTSGTAASLNALTAEDLATFYRRWVRPDNATLLVVGDTTLAEIRPLLEKHLRRWRTPAEALSRKDLSPVTPPSRPRAYLVNFEGAEQSVIIAAQTAPSRSDPDSTALQAANQVLGGGFLSRLNLNLREEKHWAYGARSAWQGNRGPGLFSASVSVQTDKTAEAMRELLKEFTDVRSVRPPTAEELQAARDDLVLRLPARAETLAGVADLYGSIITFGLPATYWSDFALEAQGLTSTQVGAAAQRLLQTETLTWVVVGDLSKIEGAVRALEIGDVHVLDMEGSGVR